MEKINLFLTKYNYSLFTELKIKNWLVDYLNTQVNIKVSDKDINFSPKSIFIKTNPKIKAKLKLIEKKIIKDLHSQFKNLPLEKIV